MKLSLFCAVLLLVCVYVIYQQKGKLDELKGQLATATERVEKLQHDLDLAKQAAARPAPAQPGPAASPGTVQQPRSNNGAWMYEKSAGGALGNSSGLGGGPHK